MPWPKCVDQAEFKISYNLLDVGVSVCKSNAASCTNTQGSYDCSCLPGYINWSRYSGCKLDLCAARKKTFINTSGFRFYSLKELLLLLLLMPIHTLCMLLPYTCILRISLCLYCLCQYTLCVCFYLIHVYFKNIPVLVLLMPIHTLCLLLPYTCIVYFKNLPVLVFLTPMNAIWLVLTIDVDVTPPGSGMIT